MSASKIAVIAGTSPFQTRESLLLQMSGFEAQQEPSGAMLRGLRAEAWIRDLVRFEHPDWEVVECGGFARVDEPRFIATPDGLLSRGGEVFALLEVKYPTSCLSVKRHGAPDHYRDQAQWQMHVTGCERVVFAVSDRVRLGGFEHVEQTVPRDQARIDELAELAGRFLAELDTGRTGA